MEIVLKTEKSVLRKIKHIAMEYHEYFNQKANHQDLMRYLESCGFRVWVKKTLFSTYVQKTGLIFAEIERG